MANTHTENQASLSERLGEIADRFSEEIEQGQAPDVETYLAEHADLSHVLRPLLTALAEIETGGLDQLADGECRKKVLGDFRIVREIGRGGMGIVYEAEQVSMGRMVALKVLPFASMIDPKPLERFRNEVRAVGTLDHPHIVSVYSVGKDRGVYFYAMQLIRGQSLATVIKELQAMRRADGTLSGSSISDIVAQSDTRDGVQGTDETTTDVRRQQQLPEQSKQGTRALADSGTIKSVTDRNYYLNVTRLGIQAAEALSHAHENGIVHRDIKPGNLILDTHGQLFVTDFGLARIEAAGITMTGDWLGTPRYMSPEQALGKPLVIDHRADIYSLGVTLYELLTLRPAFDADDRKELLRQIANDEPERLRAIDRHMPRELETIVLKAISKNRDERYDTAADLAADLQCYLEDKPIKARPPTLVQRAARWSRQHKSLVASAAVLLVLLTIGLAVSTLLIDVERRRAGAAAARERDQKAIAVQERNAAQDARDKEQEARERAETALQLLVTSLRSPDPERDGRTIKVVEVLAQAEATIEADLQEQPAMKAQLLNALGETYTGLGLYSDAVQSL